jgi:hypothetical protein
MDLAMAVQNDGHQEFVDVSFTNQFSDDKGCVEDYNSLINVTIPLYG